MFNSKLYEDYYPITTEEQKKQFLDNVPESTLNKLICKYEAEQKVIMNNFPLNVENINILLRWQNRLFRKLILKMAIPSLLVYLLVIVFISL